jgi:hypothetical protein
MFESGPVICPHCSKTLTRRGGFKKHIVCVALEINGTFIQLTMSPSKGFMALARPGARDVLKSLPLTLLQILWFGVRLGSLWKSKVVLVVLVSKVVTSKVPVVVVKKVLLSMESWCIMMKLTARSWGTNLCPRQVKTTRTVRHDVCEPFIQLGYKARRLIQ